MTARISTPEAGPSDGRFGRARDAFTPVLTKHLKSFLLIDCISVGVDRMQRNFEPMRKQVEAWQRSELTDVNAKVVIYEAFIEGRLEAPKHLARSVHDLYSEPKYVGFRAENDLESFQSVYVGIQGADPIPQFKATAKLGEIPGGPVLAVVLARGAVSAGRPFPDGTPTFSFGDAFGRCRGIDGTLQPRHRSKPWPQPYSKA
jgi:hypothetical protein